VNLAFTSHIEYDRESASVVCFVFVRNSSSLVDFLPTRKKKMSFDHHAVINRMKICTELGTSSMSLKDTLNVVHFIWTLYNVPLPLLFEHSRE
jgi:hypothetical protein